MRILISGGGTGGHVYPALAVANQFLSQSPPAEQVNQAQPSSSDTDAHSVVWVGSVGGMEQGLVEREGIPYYGISTGQLRGKNPLTAAKNAGKMLTGVNQSRRLLSELRPHACLVTGGYVCAPMVAACRQQGVPVLIYLPDMSPGSAIRWLSRLANSVAVSFPDAASYFGGLQSEGGKAVVTGYPVRKELVKASRDRTSSRSQLAEMVQRPSLVDGEIGSEEQLPLLLVWGGSQGSRSINMATWNALSQLLLRSHVVHIVGERDREMGQEIINEKVSAAKWDGSWTERYHPVDYLHEAMPYALAAADLTVARAGASILGEFPVAGLPSILVPLPIAGVKQLLNANELESHDAALVIQDDRLETMLAPTVVALFDDRDRLAKMEAAVRALAMPDAADRIVQELEQLSVTK